jgi:hypothetical protein
VNRVLWPLPLLPDRQRPGRPSQKPSFSRGVRLLRFFDLRNLLRPLETVPVEVRLRRWPLGFEEPSRGRITEKIKMPFIYLGRVKSCLAFSFGALTLLIHGQHALAAECQASDCSRVPSITWLDEHRGPPTKSQPSRPKGASQFEYWKVRLGVMEVFNGVARNKDSDYVSLSVTGPDGKVGPVTSGRHEVQKGSKEELNLTSDTIRVPATDPNRMVQIEVGGENVGTPVGQKMALALGDTLTEQGSFSGNPLVTAMSVLGKAGLDELAASCDTVLFKRAVIVYLDRLDPTEEKDEWEPKGKNLWFRVLDFNGIQSGCDHGHYNLAVEISQLP